MTFFLGESIERMEWPVNLSDSNPIEQLWDQLERSVHSNKIDEDTGLDEYTCLSGSPVIVSGQCHNKTLKNNEESMYRDTETQQRTNITDSSSHHKAMNSSCILFFN